MGTLEQSGGSRALKRAGTPLGWKQSKEKVPLRIVEG